MEEQKILNLMTANVAILQSVHNFLVKHSMKETSPPAGLLSPTKYVLDF